MYQLVSKDGQVTNVKKTDGSYICIIPLAPDNTDYQQYLKWVAEGNTPTSADEGTQ